jgi:mannose-1-phosphate guanylyltransferase
LKAFLLAAGMGSRLRPLTDSVPKCLVPIRGKPLIEIWLELFRRAGVRQVLVNLHAHADAVVQFLKNRPTDPEVLIIQEPVLLGSAGTLAANRAWLGGDPSFWVCYADVLTNADLQKMMEFHKHHPSAATLGVSRVREPRRCGIAVVAEGGRIEQFIEKPADPPGNLAFTGILIGTHALLDAIPGKLPADLGFDVLPSLAGRMFAYPIHEFLMDIGTTENYEGAQSSWLGL